MENFNFTIPQKLIFGVNSLNQLPKILKNNNLKNVLLIADKELEKIGIVQKIVNILQKEKITFTSYLDILPNPTTHTVNCVVDIYKKNNSSTIIVLGGGSSIDVAKAVGILASFGGNIIDYEGISKVPDKIIPIIAIPTTAGTGSEVTNSCVITDEKRNHKMSIISHNILPIYSILDPTLIMTTPPLIAASCGIDSLVHAIEAYISNFSSPFSDMMAEKSMELIGNNIRTFITNRKNKEAASAMMLGCSLSGIAFSIAKLGNIHAMSHPISTYFNVPHGIANGILLPTIIEYNSTTDSGRYEKIYNYLNSNKKHSSKFISKMLVDELRQLNQDIGIPSSLSEVGVTEDKIEIMAKDAIINRNILANPRKTSIKDIIRLYKQAF